MATWNLNAGLTGKPLLQPTTSPGAVPCLLLGLQSPAQYLAQTRNPEFAAQRLTHCCSTVCTAKHRVKWAALCWPLSLSRTGLTCLLTSPSSRSLATQTFFIRMHTQNSKVLFVLVEHVLKLEYYKKKNSLKTPCQACQTHNAIYRWCI